MIYTVTFNPALDYVLQLPRLEPGAVNRCTDPQIQYGGKGINVSVMLRRLGVESVALGFAGGFTGRELMRGLADLDVRTDFVQLPEGETRINVKLNHGQETELNAPGPDIPEPQLQELLHKLDFLADGDALILAGSIPACLPGDLYRQILARLAGKRLLTVVDADGPLLKSVLEYHPFLIKPNTHELASLFGREPQTTEEVADAALRLQKLGARNVLVSRAAEGALLRTEEGEVLVQAAPAGTVQNSVGAGDSMVAGFLAGWLQNHSPRKALLLGTAAGSATAFCSGLAGSGQVEHVLYKMQSGGRCQ